MKQILKMKDINKIKRLRYNLNNSLYMLIDKILDKPHEIKIELTYRCNKKCEFCFNKNPNRDNNIDNKKDEMNTKEVFYLLDKINKCGIKRVRFTGGEPLIRKDIYEIIKYAKNKGLIVKLNTNGSLINNENISWIKEYCDEILFSIHNINDKDIKNLIKNIKEISSFGVYIAISTIATRENINKFNLFKEIVNEISPNKWYWNYPIPISKEIIEWKDIIRLANNIKITKLRTECYGIRFPLCKINKDLMKYIKGCKNCGPHDHLVVNPYGEIHLCNSFNIYLGNIKDDLLDIWKNNKLVKEFRTLNILPEKCKICTKLKRCYGGCRYSAYLYTKKLNGEHILSE